MRHPFERASSLSACTLLVAAAALSAGCGADAGAGGEVADTDTGGTADAAAVDPTLPGTPAPAWALPDFQPASEASEERSGLEAFSGQATLVAFLSGW